jgi:hypothetical protein
MSANERRNHSTRIAKLSVFSDIASMQLSNTIGQ